MLASPLWTRATAVCSRRPSSVASLTHSWPGRRLWTLSSNRIGGSRVHPASSRCESSLVAKSLDSSAPALLVDMPEAGMQSSGNLTSGLPEFSTLEGIVSKETLRAITVSPFKLTHMSAVQAEVLPLLPELAEPYSPDSFQDNSQRPPRDLLVKAKTGTGKTLAFLVPAIEARLKAVDVFAKQAAKDAGFKADKAFEARARRAFTREHVGTLIISPTRELATQIAKEAQRLTHHHDGFEVQLFVGGLSKRMQMRDWMKGRRDIVVATPGRLRDLLNSEPDVAKGLSKTKLLILDEADTLLDMGFREDIEAIAEFLPGTPERQTFLFSATVSRAIQQVARATLDKNHVFINTVSESTSPVHANVSQYHTVLPAASHQIPHMLRLLAHDQLTNPGTSKAIVFLPTTKMTQLFATLLRELSKTTLPAGSNTKVYEIHSKRTMDARMMTSDVFRRDQSGASILVTSDVSARGVDYPNVTRVIQVGIPAGTEQYIHRVGRTGRAGTSGRGDLVLLPWEVDFLSWQLSQVPLRPLTVSELTSQVDQLATQHDADPAEFAKAMPTRPIHGNKGRLINAPKRLFSPCVTQVIADIPSSVSSLLDTIDEEAVKETFVSLLGYYLGKSAELRTQKSVIVDGCKDWTTQAIGLPTPPYVSALFLQKLGVSDSRTKQFGKRPAADREWGKRTGQRSWEGRGQQRSNDRAKETRSWGKARGLNENDIPGRSDTYKSRRYGGAFGGGVGGRQDDFAGGGREGFEDRRARRDVRFGRRDGGPDRDGGESGYGMRP